MAKIALIGTSRPEAVCSSAKEVAQIARDMASFTTADDASIPQVGLCISLQAVEREAGLLGGLDKMDVLFAYATAFGTFLARNVAQTRHGIALAEFEKTVRGALVLCPKSGQPDGGGL